MNEMGREKEGWRGKKKAFYQARLSKNAEHIHVNR